jgi:hypothetical protein
MQKYPFECIGADASTVANALSEYGIAFMSEYLNNINKVAAVEAEALRLLNDHPHYAQALSNYPDGNGFRVERERVSADCAQLSGVFDQPWMREVAKTFFGPQPYVFNHDLMIVLDAVGIKHLAHQVHYDRMPQLKFFLYLTDTSVANGAFHCLPGSHHHAKKIQQENRCRLQLPSSPETRLRTPEFTSGLIPVEGRAGSLMIIDSDIAHRGTEIRRGHRLSVRCRSYHPAYLTRWTQTYREGTTSGGTT